MCDQEEHVVCEVPVYLSKALSKKLYIVQHPQRPATVPIKKSEIAETKIKETMNKIQMTLEVETDSQYYDEFHGELLAEAAEGLGLNEDEYIPDTRKKIDKKVLEATCLPKLTNPARYVAGIVKDGAVHLTPLKAVVQMKSTLPFLNKADKAKARHENAGVDTEDEAEEEATKVTVKFKRHPIDPNKSTATKSSFSARKKEEEEPWVPVEYEENNLRVYKQLCTPHTDNDVPMYVLAHKDYLQKLFPKHVETVIDGSDNKAKASLVPQRINVQGMKELPLPEQLKVLMINGKVMRYDQVVDFLRTRLHVFPDETTLLRTLQTVAVLVQGCWVVRSELVYPDAYKSNANGISGTVMQAARDTVVKELLQYFSFPSTVIINENSLPHAIPNFTFLKNISPPTILSFLLQLSFFTEQRIVERRKLASLLHLPNEELTEILSNISQRIVKKGWEFLLPFDHSFTTKHSDIVQRQNMIWEVKNQHRNRKVSESSNKEVLKPPTKSPPRRRHSRTMSYSSDNDSGTEAESRGRRASGGGMGRQRRPSSRSASESSSSLLGVPSRVES